MTTFDDRDKSFENKFAHDEELAFKTHARRNKLLGLWAASKMGKDGAEAMEYAKDIVLTEFESSGSGDVIEKLLKDFGQAHIQVTEKEIQAEMDKLAPVARKQIMGEES